MQKCFAIPAINEHEFDKHAEFATRQHKFTGAIGETICISTTELLTKHQLSEIRERGSSFAPPKRSRFRTHPRLSFSDSMPIAILSSQPALKVVLYKNWAAARSKP